MVENPIFGNIFLILAKNRFFSEILFILTKNHKFGFKKWNFGQKFFAQRITSLTKLNYKFSCRNCSQMPKVWSKMLIMVSINPGVLGKFSYFWLQFGVRIDKYGRKWSNFCLTYQPRKILGWWSFGAIFDEKF